MAIAYGLSGEQYSAFATVELAFYQMSTIQGFVVYEYLHYISTERSFKLLLKRGTNYYICLLNIFVSVFFISGQEF